MIEFDNVAALEQESPVKIKVIGIGGAGGNTVNSMIDSDLAGVEFIVANTDAQALKHSKAYNKIHLGAKSTKGLGAGANPDLGRRATEEDLENIMQAIGDADIVFIAAGMGGGTGSGGAPVIAKALRERGVLSIAVVTKPFLFEGKRRMVVAQESLELLKKEVDTLLIIPNQKLLDVVDRSVSMIDSFAMVNDLLIHCVKSIADIIVRPGHINVDFADLRATMKGMGLAMMGTGKASGQDRALHAAMQAISSNLIENMDIKKAKGVLLNITGGSSLTLHEINDAASVIYDQSNEFAHIIIGSVVDPLMTDEVVVSIIATGFEEVAVQPTKVVAAKVEPVAKSFVQEVVRQEAPVERVYTQVVQSQKAAQEVVKEITPAVQVASPVEEIKAAPVAPVVHTVQVQATMPSLEKEVIDVAPAVASQIQVQAEQDEEEAMIMALLEQEAAVKAAEVAAQAHVAVQPQVEKIVIEKQVQIVVQDQKQDLDVPAFMRKDLIAKYSQKKN